MATRRELALTKVLAAAAWADGRLENSERNRIKERMLAFGFGPEELREIDVLLEAPVSYARCEELTRDLMAQLTTRQEREDALRQVEDLLLADGFLAEEEREVLDGLRGIMDAMTTADAFMARITGVFRRVFSSRDPGDPPGELSEFLKNRVLTRLHDLSGGAWRESIDARSLNRYTLMGAVLGRVAQAEGGISEAEGRRIREILASRCGLEPPLLDWTLQAVRESAAQQADRQGLLAEFNRVSDSGERGELLDAAFAVAAADGVVSPAELAELRLISNFLWLDPREFNAIRLRWETAAGGSPPSDRETP
jgi:uncharacterized tellurite resistance protein B-like protein